MIGFNGRNLGAKLNIIKQRSPFVLVNIYMIDNYGAKGDFIMVKEFVSAWDANKDKLKTYIRDHMQDMYMSDYKDLVKLLFDIVINPHVNHEYFTEDITVIDHGDYQGTIVFLLYNTGYKPDIDDYVYTSVQYGSCSCCDVLQSIQYDDTSDQEKVNDYMTLMLHLLQHCNTMTK